MSTPEVIKTGDGSHSLYLKEIDETYHSRHGAIQESQHVFIENGLNYHLSKDPKQLNILEIGMGTGLNVWLTYKTIKDLNTRIEMTTLEPFPLDMKVIEMLNYAGSAKEKKEFIEIHSMGWEKRTVIGTTFNLLKTKTKISDFDSPMAFDLVYFDAFAPSKQPEMWRVEILRRIAGLMKPGSVLVTYCAQGQFKRDLISVGFHLETLEGPPGKKEMVRAIL